MSGTGRTMGSPSVEYDPSGLLPPLRERDSPHLNSTTAFQMQGEHNRVVL
jgi:hypothetical protein